MTNLNIRIRNKHPSGIWVLAIGYALFIYAYIEINALLVLFSTQYLHLSTTYSYSLFGAFNALVFTSPLLGGYISEKFGHKYAAAVGVFISMIGICILSVEHIYYFYLGLAIYIVGYGI